MNRAPLPEIVAVVPWDEQRGIPAVLHDHPQFGFVLPEQMRKVRAPVRIRIDSNGGYHLLGEAGDIVHLDAGGAVAGRTPLGARGDRVIDYACDPGRRCVLLEQTHDADGQPFNRLRSLELSGDERWTRSGPLQVGELDFAQLRGIFQRLVLHGHDRLYLPAEHHGDEVAEIDLATGAVRRVVPHSAIDADLTTAGQSPALSYDGIAVRAEDRQVFTSHAVTGGVAITGKNVQIVLSAPSGFSLVHVAADGRYYLLGGEGPGQPGELRIYATGGQLESVGRLPADLLTLECRIPTPDTWQVDGAGRAIVPVVIPQGIAVVALRPR